MSDPADQIIVPLLRSYALSDDEEVNRVINRLDGTQIIVMRTEKRLCRIRFVQGCLFSVREHARRRYG